MGRISDGSPEGRVRGPEEEEGELRRQRWLVVRCGASLCFCFLAGTFVSSLLVPVRASARSFPATVCAVSCFFFRFQRAFWRRFWCVIGRFMVSPAAEERKKVQGTTGGNPKEKRKIVSGGGVRRKGEDLSQTTL